MGVLRIYSSMKSNSECADCGYFVRYGDGSMSCLMKQEFCIVEGVTSYPKDCEYYEVKYSKKR